MGAWLSPDSKLYNGLVTVADTIIINVLLVIASLPVVTAGAAVTGAHRALLLMMRDEGSSPARAFWKGFTGSFWRATTAWLAILALFAAAAWEIWAIGRMDLGAAGAAVIVVAIIGILLVAGFAVWFFPALTAIAAPFSVVVRDAGLLSIGFLPRTLACLALVAAQPVILYVSIDTLGVLVFANLVILPAAILYLQALMVAGPLAARAGEENPLA